MELDYNIDLHPVRLYDDSIGNSFCTSVSSATDYLTTLTSKERSGIYFSPINKEERKGPHVVENDEDLILSLNDPIHTIVHGVQTMEMQRKYFRPDNSLVRRCIVKKDNYLNGDRAYESSTGECHLACSKLFEKQRLEAIYRLRMGVWCYNICDCIKASRHIVAVAFNYLDRFLDAGNYLW